MYIRKFNEKDRASLIELWKKVFPEDPPHNEPSEVIEAKLAVDDMIWLAEDDDEIIGACMIGYDGHRGWLYAVAVLPEYRRKGTGSLLVKHALQHLRKLGCIKVNLQVRSTNTDVVEFYKSLGFKIEDRISMGMLIK